MHNKENTVHIKYDIGQDSLDTQYTRKEVNYC